MPSTTSRRTAKKRQLNWDVNDEEIPAAGRPDAELLARRQRWYRRLVWSCVVLAPLALLTLLVVIGSKHTTPTKSRPAAAAVTSPGRTAATQDLDAWLGRTPSPLPGATVLSWDGAKTIDPPPQPKSGGVFSSSGGSSTPVWKTEIDTFTLVVPAPKPTTGAQVKATTAAVYQASVAVALDPHGGAVSMGGPSLIREPKTPTSQWFVGGPWSGIQSSTTISGPVQQAVNGWLSAYTSGNSSSLSLAIGDTNGSHVYIPLSGVHSATDAVVASAPRVAPNNPVPTSNSHKVTASAEIVEVTLDITWDGQSPPPQTFQGTTTEPQTTMDLLVERANTAAPVVVAWGPPGTGPGLQPYQNAVSSAQVTSGS